MKQAKHGFVYKWTHQESGKYYIGSHQGDQNDGYIGSGLIFKAAVQKHGITAFNREILYEGPDFLQHEEKILNALDAASDSNSYNLKNEAIGGSFPGEKNGMHGKSWVDFCTEEKYLKYIENLKKNRWSPEQRKEFSKRISGSGNPMYGVNRKGSFAAKKISQTKKANKEKWGFLGHPNQHRTIFLKILRRLTEGEFVSPREQLVLERENFSYELPPYVRFMNFECRKLNLDYIKTEFLWYLKGDRFDTSICQHAKIWKKIVNEDGSINSNYGQYIFQNIATLACDDSNKLKALNQFDNVVYSLAKDQDSRQASMTILTSDHLMIETDDIPCTYSLNFRIRNNKLNMSVHMRSQDAIFGMGNDAPAFSFIHEMMLNALKRYYPKLEYGNYFHTVDSFHVYERHFDMFEKLTSRRGDPYCLILCPKISGPDEVDFLRRMNFSEVPLEFQFTNWLLENAEK